MWTQPPCPTSRGRINSGPSKAMEDYSEPKRKELWSHRKPWWNLKWTWLNERSQSGKTRYWMIPTIGHSGKGKNCGDSQKRSAVFKGWEERCMSKAQRTFRAVKLPCKTLQWWVHVITHLAKLTESATPRVTSMFVWTLVTAVYPCRFTSCKKRSILARGFDSGGGYAWEGREGMWEIPAPFHTVLLL